MKKFAILIIALVVFFPAAALGGENFEYGGISTDDTLETLKAKHPNSDWSSPSKSPTHFVSHMFLYHKDLHDKISIVKFITFNNRKTIHVSLQDDSGERPSCDEIRKILEKQYGPANNKIDPPWMGGPHEWTYRHWTRHGNSMALHCFRPERKGNPMASAIKFERLLK